MIAERQLAILAVNKNKTAARGKKKAVDKDTGFMGVGAAYHVWCVCGGGGSRSCSVAGPGE